MSGYASWDNPVGKLDGSKFVGMAPQDWDVQWFRWADLDPGTRAMFGEHLTEETAAAIRAGDLVPFAIVGGGDEEEEEEEEGEGLDLAELLDSQIDYILLRDRAGTVSLVDSGTLVAQKVTVDDLLADAAREA